MQALFFLDLDGIVSDVVSPDIIVLLCFCVFECECTLLAGRTGLLLRIDHHHLTK
jgi:hypothetical protein